MTFKIATYNLRYGGRDCRHWSRLIEDHQVDVLLVQESYPPESHRPPLLHPRLSEQTVWSAVGSNPWGSGIFVAEGTLTPLPLAGEFNGSVVGAELTGAPWQAGRRTLLFSIHALENAAGYHASVHAILDAIEKLDGADELIIAGDFNLTISQRHPTEDRATRPEHLGVQNRLRDQFGLMNCWQSANPNIPLAQTLRWSGDRETPYHCDGLFVPQSWQSGLRSCEVLSGKEWDLASDHNPVIATFGE